MSRKRTLTDEEKALWEQEKRDGFPLVLKQKSPKTTPKPIKFRKKLVEIAPIPQNRLDLHGMSAATAHNLLVSFIKTQFHLQNRKLLVITGKGSGMLREALPQWLSTAELSRMVSACEIAKAKDGGDGAYYVTLRKIRPKSL